MSYSSNSPESTPARRRIAVLGGGVGGWLTAAVLARALHPEHFEVQLLDESDSPRAPRAFATQPVLGKLLALLGSNESELMRHTRATCTLGAQFNDWGRLGEGYFRGFGPVGARLDGVAFHQHWLLLKQRGEALPYEDYCIAALAARTGRFAPPLADRHSPFFWYAYAYHVDCEHLAGYLRDRSARGRVAIRRGIVVGVKQHTDSGALSGLQLDDGSSLEADLYIDCTGRREGVLPRALDLRWQDWGQCLPYDRALVGEAAQVGDPPAHSRFVASEQGWQWQIPLRDRIEVGYAYSPQFASEAQVAAALRAACAGLADRELRPVRFSCGRPEKFWIANCLFLGACDIGPLAATELYLLQSGLTRLLAQFPAFIADQDRASAAEYNRLSALEHDGIRDFAAAHFKVSNRQDSPLWQHCRAMEVSSTLRHRLDLFCSSGRLNVPVDECFTEEDWLALLLGLQLRPAAVDPLARCSDPDATRTALDQLATIIRQGVQHMPTHGDYLARHGH